MINENKSVRDLKRMVLIGAIVALVSQLYWNLFVYNFRISSSVIVLPVLLMTLGKNLSTTMTCSVTAVIVFLFRRNSKEIRKLKAGSKRLQNHLG